MWKKPVSVIFCLGLIYTISGASIAKTDDVFKKLTIPVEKYTLPNGLTVLLSEDHNIPFVAVNVWYQVGAQNEEHKKTGLAHLFEHKMFEGSRQVKDANHFRLLEKAGAFDINASTSFSRTNYYETVPKRDLELALSLESSRMYFLDINQEKLDEQRAVVRREREQRFETAPYGDAATKIWQSIFPKKHPLYGRVIGSHKDLQAATLKDVQNFYDNYYGPTNASLALVGDFDKETAKALINKYFGSLPRSKPMAPLSMPKITLDKEEIITVVEKIGKLPFVSIKYITPGLYQEDDAKLDIIAHILGGGETGRLTKAVKRDKPLVASVNVAQQSMEHQSIFTIDAILNPGVTPDDFIQETDRVLAELISNPPTEAEVNKAKNSILTDQFLNLQNLGGFSGRAELLQTYNRFAGNPDFIRQDSLRYSIDAAILPSVVAKFLPPKKARKIVTSMPHAEQKIEKGN